MKFLSTPPLARALALGLAAALLPQCTVRDRENETASVTPLHFQLLSIEEATLDGLDARAWRTPTDLGLPQRSQLIRAYANKTLPLHMRLRVAARNPALQAVTISDLTYEVLLDGKVLGSQQLTPRLQLPADGRPVELPLSFDLNTYKFLGDDAMPALRNFSVGLADRTRIPPRLTLRLRPTVLTDAGRTSRPGRPVLLDADSTAEGLL